LAATGPLSLAIAETCAATLATFTSRGIGSWADVHASQTTQVVAGNSFTALYKAGAKDLIEATFETIRGKAR
jgi:hypothetical protein